MRDVVMITAFVKEWLSSPASAMPWLPPQGEWVRPLALEHRAVPLYLGWTAVVCARESGEVWLYDTDRNTGWSHASAFVRRMALKHASGACPALVPALPVRPEEAVPCGSCKGTGELRAPLVCECGGYGWLIPGEERGMGIG
jgi:hypothetical protein